MTPELIDAEKLQRWLREQIDFCNNVKPTPEIRGEKTAYVHVLETIHRALYED